MPHADTGGADGADDDSDGDSGGGGANGGGGDSGGGGRGGGNGHGTDNDNQSEMILVHIRPAPTLEHGVYERARVRFLWIPWALTTTELYTEVASIRNPLAGNGRPTAAFPYQRLALRIRIPSAGTMSRTTSDARASRRANEWLPDGARVLPRDGTRVHSYLYFPNVLHLDASDEEGDGSSGANGGDGGGGGSGGGYGGGGGGGGSADSCGDGHVGHGCGTGNGDGSGSDIVGGGGGGNGSGDGGSGGNGGGGRSGGRNGGGGGGSANGGEDDRWSDGGEDSQLPDLLPRLRAQLPQLPQRAQGYHLTLDDGSPSGVLGRACGAPLRAAPGLRVSLCEDMVAVAQCRLEGWGESVHLRSCRKCHFHRRP